MPDLEELATSLRAHAARHADEFEKAALDILIGNGTWLMDDDFRATCLEDGDYEWFIRWRDARDFLDGVETHLYSTSDLGILKLAVLLALDECHLSGLDWPARARIVNAFSMAFRLEERHA